MSPYQKGEGALLHAESSKSISRHAVGSGEEASDNPLIKTQSESVGKMTAPQEEIAAATPRHATRKTINNICAFSLSYSHVAVTLPPFCRLSRPLQSRYTEGRRCQGGAYNSSIQSPRRLPRCTSPHPCPLPVG